ncbi:MAG: hypothetical protein SH817_16025 [Leptospira sp.]|nr:hypothetical protein [Leptospira sp.]
MNISYFFEQLFKFNLEHFDESILLDSGNNFNQIVSLSPDVLKKSLKELTESYYKLSEYEKSKVKHAFISNKDIESICKDVKKAPVKYGELQDDFAELLKEFDKKLWVNYPHVDLLKSHCGTIQEHFDEFVSPKHQQALVCPFCGLHKLKPFGSIKRDSYDHYIPKSLYPFTSINFKNLFPMCNECNTDEKKATDTVYKNLVRRKVVYPFDTEYPFDQLRIYVIAREYYSPISLKTMLNDIQWDLEIKIEGYDEEIFESWDEIFNIKRRFSENLLRYQSEWTGELMIKYKIECKKGTCFKSFETELMEIAEYQKLNSPLGILKYSYFLFLFTVPDFEKIISESIL